jgi:hypothetical protein
VTSSWLNLQPVDPGKLGRVLDALARTPLTMGGKERRKIADRVRLGIARNFTTESAGGAPWPQLAVSTVMERRRLGFAGAHPIHQRTRQLKMSWTEREHPEHSESWGQFAGTVVLVLGSTDERVAWLSGDNPNIPARLMGVLSDADQAGLFDVIAYQLEAGASRLGD